MICSISGVFLSFNINRTTLPDDGYILASSILNSRNSILCNTDRADCCSSQSSDNPNETAQGDWYLPNGNIVGSHTVEVAKNNHGNFFARSRGSGIVRLYTSGNPSERGQFRCEIPNAGGVNETRYINIGESFHINMASGYRVMYT